MTSSDKRKIDRYALLQSHRRFIMCRNHDNIYWSYRSFYTHLLELIWFRIFIFTTSLSFSLCLSLLSAHACTISFWFSTNKIHIILFSEELTMRDRFQILVILCKRHKYWKTASYWKMHYDHDLSLYIFFFRLYSNVQRLFIGKRTDERSVLYNIVYSYTV